MKTGKKDRRIPAAVSALCLFFAAAETGSAMHIMEGYLQPGYCVFWGILCIPFIMWGMMSIRKTISENRKVLMILMMAGAYAFVLSALKIPSVTGSSSHPTGTGLGAILFGPAAMAVIGVVVLLFQALLLAHGGITTLGANTFSMAVAGPFAAYAVYRAAGKMKLPDTMCVFLAAFAGDLITYIVTAAQLAVAHPSETGGIAGAFGEFTVIFAVTQIPLAVIEGLVTVAVMKALESYAVPELRQLGYIREGR